MTVIIALAIMPLLGLIFAALHFAGEGAASGQPRALIFGGRFAVLLVALGCLGLLWVARGSLHELYVVSLFIGVVFLLLTSFVFRCGPGRLREAMALTGLALLLSGMVLKTFADGGWVGLARGAGWALLLGAAGCAVGFALRHFDKRRGREGAGPGSLKDSRTS